LEGVAKANGVSDNDIAAIDALLLSTEPDIVKLSICDKYSMYNTAYKFLSKLTHLLLQGLVEDPITAVYFNGSHGTTDYQTNRKAFNNLNQLFIEYFGLLFQCTDGTIPPYTGVYLFQSHITLGIQQREYDEFIALFVTAATDSGVAFDDLPLFVERLNSVEYQVSEMPPADPYFNEYPYKFYTHRGHIAGILISAAFGAVFLALLVLIISVALPLVDKPAGDAKKPGKKQDDKNIELQVNDH